MVIYDQAGWQCQRRPYPLISVATIWTMDPLFPTFSPPFYSPTRKEDGQYYTVKMGDITQCCVGYKSYITRYYPYRGRGRLRIIQNGRKGKCLAEILQQIGSFMRLKTLRFEKDMLAVPKKNLPSFVV